MERFEVLLAGYEDDALDADGRAELAALIETDPDCREAFVDLVSQQRIRRLALWRR